MEKTKAAGVKIGNRIIGYGKPCFIVAEIGLNHNGRVDWAMDMIMKAKQSGADAVKLQTFKTDRFMHKDNCEFDTIKSLELSYPNQEKLFRFAKKNGIVIFSTPEDYESVDFLESMNVPAYKIASMDMDYYPFIEYIAKKQRPIILSTGMSSLEDVNKALRVIYKTKNKKVILMHCVSNYPANPEELNLRAISAMKRKFALPVGFSDHALGNTASLAAVCLGADIIEKHFTLSKKLPGDDHVCSMDPQDLKYLVRDVRNIELSLGNGIKRPAKSEMLSMKLKKRGLYAKSKIKRGERITIDKLEFLCPGKSIAVSDLHKAIGKKARSDIKAGSPIEWFQLD